MALSKGVSKSVVYKKEAQFGVPVGGAGGTDLRRVTADFNLAKEAYESNEIRRDFQTAINQHGVRSATGTLNGELSPASYAPFMGSILARDFTSGVALTGLELTVAASGANYTLTRAAGSWLTDGVKVGNIIRATAGLAVGSLNKNLLVAGVTALSLTVVVMDASTLVIEAAVAGCAVSAPGKQTFVPLTGHTDDSYSVEQFFADIGQSEVYSGMKVNSIGVSLPASGLATVDIGFAGKDLAVKGTTPFFTSPTAANTNAVFASVNGRVLFDGVPVAVITDANFTIDRATENAMVLGSNSLATIFTGRITASGSLSVYFQDTTFRDAFDNETEFSLVFSMTNGSAPDAPFISFVLPKNKGNSFTVSDGELGLTASVDFVSLLNSDETEGLPATTIMIQDSTLV